LHRPGAGHSNFRHGPRGTEHLPPPPAVTPSPTTLLVGSVALRQRTRPLEQPRRARQVVRVPEAADTFLPWYVVSRTLHAVMHMTVHSERACGASPLGAAAVRSGLNGAGTGSRGRAPVLPPLQRIPRPDLVCNTTRAIKRQIQQQHEKRTTCVGASARECPLVHRGRARGMGYSAHRKEGRRRLRHEASDWCRRCAGAGGGCRRRSARSCRSEETCGWNQTERAHGIMLKRQIPFLSKRRVTSCRSTAAQGIPPATVNRERRLATAPTMQRDRAIASAALPVRRLRASAVACR
jgi:hypothetical protein